MLPKLPAGVIQIGWLIAVVYQGVRSNATRYQITVVASYSYTHTYRYSWSNAIMPGTSPSCPLEEVGTVVCV